jgi:hypothetical protein
VTADLTDAAREAIRRARQLYDQVVLNAPAGVAEELLQHGLVAWPWVMDGGGRVAWPLTGAGLALRDELKPPDPEVWARAKKVAAQIMADLQSGGRR